MVNKDWTAESLNDAYRKGYFIGLSGRHRERCPFDQQPIMASAWEAGWHDGLEAVRERRLSQAAVKLNKGTGGR